MDETMFVRCITALLDLYPSMQSMFEQDAHMSRWYARFRHVSEQEFMAALEDYADGANRAPSVIAISRHLPKGRRGSTREINCAHAWEQLPDGNAVCQRCGMHGADCICSICVCDMEGHPGGRLVKTVGTIGFYSCPTCHATYRRAHAIT